MNVLVGVAVAAAMVQSGMVLTPASPQVVTTQPKSKVTLAVAATGTSYVSAVPMTEVSELAIQVVADENNALIGVATLHPAKSGEAATRVSWRSPGHAEMSLQAVAIYQGSCVSRDELLWQAAERTETNQMKLEVAVPVVLETEQSVVLITVVSADEKQIYHLCGQVTGQTP